MRELHTDKMIHLKISAGSDDWSLTVACVGDLFIASLDRRTNRIHRKLFPKCTREHVNIFLGLT